jgi:hypothetical protein
MVNADDIISKCNEKGLLTVQDKLIKAIKY